MAQDVCIFLQEVLMTVDADVVIKIFYGLPGMRNMGLAKQHRSPLSDARYFGMPSDSIITRLYCYCGVVHCKHLDISTSIVKNFSSFLYNKNQ